MTARRLALPLDPPLTPDAGPAREAARAELSDPAYQAQEPSLLQRFAQWIWDRISDLLDRASAPGPGGGLATVLLIAVAVLAVVVLWLRLGPREARGQRRTDLFAEVAATAAEHHAAADAALAAGDVETAIVERFRALVRGSEERGLLVARPGRTAEEVAHDLAAQLPGAAAAVAIAAAAFGEVRYGGRPATLERHAAIASADRELRSARTPEPAP
ncbi:MAG: DUF4129 domain-containing protein [Sporichthyaceae bacterium]